jgi:hypothetical protein
MLVGPSVGTPTLTTRVPDLQNVNLRGWSMRCVRVPKGQHRAQRPGHILSSPSVSQVKTRYQNSKMTPSQWAEVSLAPYRHGVAAPERVPSHRSRILGQRLRCPPPACPSTRSRGRSRGRHLNGHVGVMRVRVASVGGGGRRRDLRARLARALSRYRPPARICAAGREWKGRAGSLCLR